MFTRDIFESSIMHGLADKNPEFELEAQRVFEALILSADDHGRGRLILQNIRIKAFGSAPNSYIKVKPDQIEEWVNQIAEQGAIQIYEANGEKYYYLTGWEKYQSGKWHKRNSTLPEPPGFSSQTSKKLPEKVEQEKGSKGKKKEKAKKTSETPEQKALRKECVEFCREVVPKKCGIASQLKSQVDALIKLITSDQDKNDIEKLYSAEEWKERVFAVLRWAREDTADKHEGDERWDGWDKPFQSIPRLRDDSLDKFIKIEKSYSISEKKKKGKKKKIDDPTKFKETGKAKL
jgi:hypothetical protein